MENPDALVQATEISAAFQNLSLFMSLLIALMILDVGLKAWAMWRAAKMNKRFWFVILLLVNSLGLLPLLFLAFTKEHYRKCMCTVTPPPSTATMSSEQ